MLALSKDAMKLKLLEGKRKVIKFTKQRLAKRNDSLTTLLIDWDGLQATALIMLKEQHKWTLVHRIELAANRPAQLIESLFEQLKTQSIVLPDTAILISSAVVCDVIELPITSGSAVDDERAKAMLRWEVEPLLSDFYSAWSLTRVLVSLNYLTDDLAQDLNQQINQQRLEARTEGGVMPRSFTEQCLDLGYLTKSELEHAIDLQEFWQLRDTSDFTLHHRPIAAHESDDGVRFLVNALDTRIRDSWRENLAANGVSLSNIVAPESVLEYLSREQTQAHFVLHKLDRVRVVSQSRNRAFQLSDLSANAEVDDNGIVFGEPMHERIANDLVPAPLGSTPVNFDDELRLNNRLIDYMIKQCGDIVDVASVSTAVLVKHGVAFIAHTNMLTDQGALLHVPSADPPPAIYRRPGFYKIAMIVVGLAVIGFTEAFFQYNVTWYQQQLVVDAIELEKKQIANQKIIESNEKLSANLIQARKQLSTNSILDKKLQNLNQVVNDRRRSSIDLLDLFAAAISEDVYLMSIEETSWNRYSIIGWGKNEGSIRELASELVALGEDINIKLENSPATSNQLGFANLSGYGFTLDLYRDVTVEQPAERREN
jgi:hypothetical protein